MLENHILGSLNCTVTISGLIYSKSCLIKELGDCILILVNFQDDIKYEADTILLFYYSVNNNQTKLDIKFKIIDIFICQLSQIYLINLFNFLILSYYYSF